MGDLYLCFTIKTCRYTDDGHQHPPRHMIVIIMMMMIMMMMMIPNIGSNMVTLILRIQDVASKNVYSH
jgi:hypothetical protein